RPGVAPGGPDVDTDGIETPVERIEQLPPEREVAVDHVRVVELVSLVGAGLDGDLSGPGPQARDERRGDAFRARQELDLGTEGPHRLDLLDREGIRADDPQRVALDRADERERA